MFNCGNRDCETNDRGTCLVKTIPCVDYKPKCDKLILLVGESGSGKTAIAEELEKIGYNYIQSYTTRPKRHEGERGHIFVDEKETKLYKAKDMMAYTFFDNYHYWTMKDQYQGKGTSIYIVDTKGIEDVRKNVDDAEITTIYIKVDDAVRHIRMVGSERSCKEIIQRNMHDKEKFKLIKCNYVVDNNGSLEETVETIKQIIEGNDNVL